MNKSDILYLNPNYLIRHDETRSLLWARDEPKPVHAYSNNFHAFIHPYYAELLALFNGGNAIEHALTQSHLGQTCGEKILGFIEKITENEKFYSSECNGTKFVFPKNLLIHKKENEEIQKQNGSTDFSFQELDFRTQKLNFPLYITYMVNTVCYTDCIYCYADCRERKKRQIPMERVRALLDEIEQHPILSFTIMGGEFFLEEHWEEILSRLHTLQLYPTISTKIPISEAVIRKLRRLNVDKIQISLDTVNPVLLNRLLNVNGERYLRDMERTFALLKEYGITTKINSVFTRYNDSVDELKCLLDFLSNYQIDSVSVIPAGYSQYKPLDYLPTKESIRKIGEFVEHVKTNYNFAIGMASDIPKEQIEGCPAEKQKTFNGRALCTGNLWQAYIMPNGDVTFCEGTMSHPAFVSGNICQKSFSEIWKTEMPHLLKRENYKNSVCGSCKEFEDCHTQKGVCWKFIVQGYGEKKVYYPDPRCPKAPAVLHKFY